MQKPTTAAEYHRHNITTHWTAEDSRPYLAPAVNLRLAVTTALHVAARRPGRAGVILHNPPPLR